MPDVKKVWHVQLQYDTSVQGVGRDADGKPLPPRTVVHAGIRETMEGDRKDVVVEAVRLMKKLMANHPRGSISNVEAHGQRMKRTSDGSGVRMELWHGDNSTFTVDEDMAVKVLASIGDPAEMRPPVPKIGRDHYVE